MKTLPGLLSVVLICSALTSTEGLNSKDWDSLAKRLSTPAPLVNVSDLVAAGNSATGIQQRCEDIGRGSCGGYNKDDKKDCDPCYRPTTYKCEDGTYREVCVKDSGCGSGC